MARSSMGAEFRGSCGRGDLMGESGQLIIRYISLPSGTYHYEHTYLIRSRGVFSSIYSAC